MVTYGEMTPDPPKNWKKNKFALKCILGHFQYFEPMFLLVENRPIRPSPLLVENATNFFKLRARSFYTYPPWLVGLSVEKSVEEM